MPNAKEMKEMADTVGVAEGVAEQFQRLSASRILSGALIGNRWGFKVGKKTVIVLHIDTSSREKGLEFRLNGIRLMNILHLSNKQLDAILPEPRSQIATTEWQNLTREEIENWIGYRCHFRNPEEVDKFLAGLQSHDVWSNDEQDEAWFQERFGKANVWLIAAGGKGLYWDDFLKEGLAAIGWNEIGDFKKYTRREDVKKALIEHRPGPKPSNPSNDSLAAWEFTRKVQIGDILIAKKGRNTILGSGKVTGDYVHDPARPGFRNIRKVEWHRCRQPIGLPDYWGFAVKTLTCFSSYKRWIRSVFGLIEKRIDGQNESRLATYDIDSALKGIFVADRQFNRILDSLANRKNLILQGSPGVGKTFIAHRIAWCLIGRKDPGPVEMVQFHQSYAYEDFVQGWRPTENGGFTMKNGVFFEFCKRAEKEENTRFVFIIDEINRGNLSRIFGELLMLIEPDKRKSDFALPLTYTHGSERFFVPSNVHILGLMNTADRSLAMVDYALRRRFAFETLEPAYHTEKFKKYLMDEGVDPPLIDRIVKEMSEINRRIREDKDLGPGFQIGHSYFVPDDTTDTTDEIWFQSIIETQIEPLLREYWFDRPAHVDELLKALRR